MSSNSRQPADRTSADRNQAVLRTLLREPGNKFCADCKSHAHPRWASWNIGVFVCIRCSGIHRSMGTHVSRVKSVDLDTWTDEQVANMVKWGNERANKYWEAGLPQGHIPAEGKIDNFIRTKYELRRWVAGGSGHEPAGAVNRTSHKQTIPASAGSARTLRTAGSPVLAYHRRTSSLEKTGPHRAAHAVKNRSIDRSIPTDLLGLDTPPQNHKSSSTSQLHGTSSSNHNGSNPLFDLPASSSSASSPNLQGHKNSSDAARPDLKRSILSLYASMPKQQQPLPGSPSAYPPQTNSRQSSFSKSDAFSSLASPNSAASGNSSKGGDSSLLDLSSVFSGVSLTNSSSSSKKAAPVSAMGSFNNVTPQNNNNNGFSSQPRPSNASSIPSSIFDASPLTSPPAAKPTAKISTASLRTAPPAAASRRKSSNTDIFGDIGGSEAWSAPTPASKPSAANSNAWTSSPLGKTANPLSPKSSISATSTQPESTLASLNSNYFSNSSAGPAKITADEEFGEFSGGDFGAAASRSTATAPKSGNGGASNTFAESSEWSSFESAPSNSSNAPPADDLFSNVWK